MEFEFEDTPKDEGGRDKMSQEPRLGNLVDTTDCLEAVSVIKCWKNFLFIIILLALLLLQGAFALLLLHKAKADDVVASTSLANVQPAIEENKQPAAADKIKKFAKQIAAEKSIAAEPNTQQPEPNQPVPVEVKISLQLRVRHISAIVRFLDFLLIPASLLYCLTMLFSFKVSLLGRLGGINHIARAFFLSLLFVVLLLPWQLLFSPIFAGAMFTPTELISACQADKTTLAQFAFYLRFTGYWGLVLLLLIFAQIRSMRWARATLRRLEVV